VDALGLVVLVVLVGWRVAEFGAVVGQVDWKSFASMAVSAPVNRYFRSTRSCALAKPFSFPIASLNAPSDLSLW
jgi:hypothetical protein